MTEAPNKNMSVISANVVRLPLRPVHGCFARRLSVARRLSIARRRRICHERCPVHGLLARSPPLAEAGPELPHMKSAFRAGCDTYSRPRVWRDPRLLHEQHSRRFLQL